MTFTNNGQTPNPYGGGFGCGFGGVSNLKVIYQWDSATTNDTAIDPTMTVDDNLATAPDRRDLADGCLLGQRLRLVDERGRQHGDSRSRPFNPNRIKVEVSSDGGNNFSPLTIADVNDATFTDDGNFMTEHDTTPAITVSQGRLPGESGQAGDAGIPGGQVTVGWDDFAANQNQIMANTISAGRDYSFGQQSNGLRGPSRLQLCHGT